MAFVKTEEFRLIQGAEALVDYQHVPDGKTEPFLHLSFCGRCGVRPFSRGGYLPALKSPFFAVNLGCLDDVDDAELARAPVAYVDGRQGTWAPIAGETGHL
jgi:hypothetical protein